MDKTCGTANLYYVVSKGDNDQPMAVQVANTMAQKVKENPEILQEHPEMSKYKDADQRMAERAEQTRERHREEKPGPVHEDEEKSEKLLNIGPVEHRVPSYGGGRHAKPESKMAPSLPDSTMGLDKGESVEELVPEHKHLVHVLEHPTKDNLKTEAKKQKKELHEYEAQMVKGADGHVASVAVMHKDSILMGKRRDNGRWTLPGGHLDDGEHPHDGGKRELLEEAGIEAPSLVHLDSSKIKTHTGKEKTIHAFKYEVSEKPKTSMVNDPDQEVERWQWVVHKDGKLPDHVKTNLHSPKNAVLDALGLNKSKLQFVIDLMKARPHKYIRKYKGKSGEWVYIYHEGDHQERITEEDMAAHKHLAEHGSEAERAHHAELLSLVQQAAQESPETKPVERSGSRTSSPMDLAIPVRVRGRTKQDGQVSLVHYESPKDSTCNLVGHVAFGKASRAIQVVLNKKVSQCELVLTEMGIRFKTPIDFVCQKVSNVQYGVYANYMQSVGHGLNPRINIIKNPGGIAKSLMHEIGHAVDYAMSLSMNGRMSESLWTARNRLGGQPGDRNAARTGQPLASDGLSDKDKKSAELFKELGDVVSSSKYYERPKSEDFASSQGYRSASRHLQNYLQKPTEMFARAFEVYAYAVGVRMVEEGRLDKSFLEGFKPDIFKEKNAIVIEISREARTANENVTRMSGQVAEARRIAGTAALAKIKAKYEGGPESWLQLRMKPEINREIESEISNSLRGDTNYQGLRSEYDLEQLRLAKLNSRLRTITSVAQSDSTNEELESGEEPEGFMVLIPQAQQKEFMAKISKIMDQVVDTDEFKRSVSYIIEMDLFKGRPHKYIRKYKGKNGEWVYIYHEGDQHHKMTEEDIGAHRHLAEHGDEAERAHHAELLSRIQEMTGEDVEAHKLLAEHGDEAERAHHKSILTHIGHGAEEPKSAMERTILAAAAMDPADKDLSDQMMGKAHQAIEKAIEEQKTYLRQHSGTPVGTAVLPVLNDADLYGSTGLTRTKSIRDVMNALHKIAMKVEQAQGDKVSGNSNVSSAGGTYGNLIYKQALDGMVRDGVIPKEYADEHRREAKATTLEVKGLKGITERAEQRKREEEEQERREIGELQGSMAFHMASMIEGIRGPAKIAQARELDQAIKAIFGKSLKKEDWPYNFESKGIKTVITGAPSIRGGDIVMKMQMYNAEGKPMMEHFERAWNKRDGRPHIHNNYMKTRDDVRDGIQVGNLINEGQRRLMKSLTDGGSVTVFADLDVGGYCWAQQGFTFEDRSSLQSMKQKFKYFLQENNISISDEHLDAFKDPVHFAQFGVTSDKKYVVSTSGGDVLPLSQQQKESESLTGKVGEHPLSASEISSGKTTRMAVHLGKKFLLQGGGYKWNGVWDSKVENDASKLADGYYQMRGRASELLSPQYRAATESALAGRSRGDEPVRTPRTEVTAATTSTSSTVNNTVRYWQRTPGTNIVMSESRVKRVMRMSESDRNEFLRVAPITSAARQRIRNLIRTGGSSGS